MPVTLLFRQSLFREDGRVYGVFDEIVLVVVWCELINPFILAWEIVGITTREFLSSVVH